jgi:hypothetical protein
LTRQLLGWIALYAVWGLMLILAAGAAVVSLEVWDGKDWVSRWGLLSLPAALLIVVGINRCFWLMGKVCDWMRADRAIRQDEPMDAAHDQREALEPDRELKEWPTPPAPR